MALSGNRATFGARPQKPPCRTIRRPCHDMGETLPQTRRRPAAKAALRCRYRRPATIVECDCVSARIPGRFRTGPIKSVQIAKSATDRNDILYRSDRAALLFIRAAVGRLCCRAHANRSVIEAQDRFGIAAVYRSVVDIASDAEVSGLLTSSPQGGLWNLHF